jgi:hypothetical protein
MTKIALSFCMALFFSTGAHANNETNISDLKSHCNSEGLELDTLRMQLAPWFAQIDLKLQTQPEYQKLAQELHSKLNDDSTILCWIKLRKTGDIERIDLNKTTGNETVDRSIKNLIRKSAPFNQPAGSICPENILVRIHNTKSLVEIASGLNTRTSIRGRIGQAVQ